MKTRSRCRSIRRVIVAVVFVAGIAFLARQMGGSVSETTGEADMSGTNVSQEGTKEAIFAGGCFWCIEATFELMPGVVEAVSGYTGGTVDNPTYEQVSTGTTGHFEAVLVVYDPQQITYEELLEQFWRSIDPTDAGGQFYDRGSQYYTAIFYLNEEQRELAETSKRALEESGVFDEPIVTQILPAQSFYQAEGYHQNYHKTCPVRYKSYSTASGRDAYLDRTWKGYDEVSLLPPVDRPRESFVNPPEEELREMLTPLQYSVTRENGTERNGRSRTSTGTTTRRASTSTSCPGSRSSARWTSSIPARVGRALPGRSSPMRWSPSGTRAWEWCAWKSGAGTRTRTWGTCSTMDHRPPASGTASTPPLCDSSRRTDSKPKGTGSTSIASSELRRLKLRQHGARTSDLRIMWMAEFREPSTRPVLCAR